jgi:signal transduction histidine kinase
LCPLTLTNTGISEFDELNAVITALTDKVISDYKTLKQFSEDASHELQTPLSIIRAKVESLLNMHHPTLEQTEIIQSIYSSVERLSKLSRSLVLLTKVENRQFRDIQQINLKESIQHRLFEFQELIQLKKLKVKTQFADDGMIHMSPSLADILINNLISNAINHNLVGGIIEIELFEHEFIICNSGEKQLETPEKIFERFHKQNQASKSIGLGLAIVKKICDTHNMKVSYSFKVDRHCFRLEF